MVLGIWDLEWCTNKYPEEQKKREGEKERRRTGDTTNKDQHHQTDYGDHTALHFNSCAIEPLLALAT